MYLNKEIKGYKEIDQLGGDDPYSDLRLLLRIYLTLMQNLFFVTVNTVMQQQELAM